MGCIEDANVGCFTRLYAEFTIAQNENPFHIVGTAFVT
jgi:hypothetical protein